MDINASDRIDASLARAEPFEQQLAAAKASGVPFATAVLPDGRRAVYFHTPDEIEHFKTYAAPPPARADSDALIEALIKKGVITREDIDAEKLNGART